MPRTSSVHPPDLEVKHCLGLINMYWAGTVCIFLRDSANKNLELVIMVNKTHYEYKPIMNPGINKGNRNNV